MRKYILYAAAAFTAVAAIGGGYFYYLNQTKAAYVVMIDITDNMKSNIDTQEVPKYIANANSQWSETTIRFSTFSNFQENKVTTVNIPAEFPLMGNPTKRKKLLQAGYQKILDTLNGIVASDNGRPQSILYAPMARELNRLAVLRAHTKQAIFYTDAQENSDAFSMYREADISLLQSNPERVKALFEKQGSLGSLKGITVYLIYNAPTPFAESHFLLITNLWKQMFETHGAKVIVAPNLTTD